MIVDHSLASSILVSTAKLKLQLNIKVATKFMVRGAAWCGHFPVTEATDGFDSHTDRHNLRGSETEHLTIHR